MKWCPIFRVLPINEVYVPMCIYYIIFNIYIYIYIEIIIFMRLFMKDDELAPCVLCLGRASKIEELVLEWVVDLLA